MKNIHLKITYIGGPMALLELGGLRLLTDRRPNIQATTTFLRSSWQSPGNRLARKAARSPHPRR
jgi:hypothetical protein